ncbi:hypothetical protein C900_03952 [Fulvivirga imtechensis AK7]|uniref:Uncharacterized protein n=1 Tax=Fulvivirga imtechensis AK7 TaxID=1237149 RepID=L8JSD6_9BACT|nr:hypothetical protein [Fulvivirga imtechensis]ELR70267.1 hypothetical protein C900_03952 [Fulvivirga imtechensis AK7]
MNRFCNFASMSDVPMKIETITYEVSKAKPYQPDSDWGKLNE